MIQFGCLAHYDHKYHDDVMFAKGNGFSFLQLWYDSNGLSLPSETNPIKSLLEINFPTIIHSVLDINEYKNHIPKLLTILHELHHNEVIIHPVCKSETIDKSIIYKLSDNINYANNIFKDNKIILYVENNSKLDPILNSIDDAQFLFSNNPDVEFLLDIAHIDNYQHLQDLIKVKYPKLIHLADRNLANIHEHLPVGKGNIDFKFIFSNILHEYDGKIIFEISQSYDDLLQSKNYVSSLFMS
jgi:sugar phosphate isomerase/epimerase